MSKLEEAVYKVQQERLRTSVAGLIYRQAFDSFTSPKVGRAIDIECACHYQHSQHFCRVLHIEVDRPVMDPLPQYYRSFRQS